VYALDAVTGAKVWRSEDLGLTTAEIIAAPAGTGPSGNAVVLAGDRTGEFHAFDAATGARTWHFSTGDTIYSSAALASGFAYVTSANGFLYAFRVGGADNDRPNTTITTPADDAQVANPNGTLTVAGNATGAAPLASVKVALRDVNQRRWWNAATSTWTTTFVENNATLGTPGATSSTWTWPYAVPFGGGRFTVQATGLDNGGRRDAIPAVADFAVESLGNPATATITSPAANATIVFPGGVPHVFDVTVSGTATDRGGTLPGVAKVWATVENVDHGEWFCGAADCNRFGPSPWTSDYLPFEAALANPGATTTAWSFDVPVYDHPHGYEVIVWAQDRDGRVQQLRTPLRFCVTETASACN
jgi:hypothetical protein